MMEGLVTSRERLSLGIFLVCLFGVFYVLMRPFVMPCLIAATIVVMSRPVYGTLRGIRFFSTKPRLTSLVMTFAVLFIIILPLTVASSVLGDQIYTLAQSLDFRDMFKNFLASSFYTGTVDPLIHDLETQLGAKINVLDFLTRFIKDRVISFYQFSPKFLLGTASYIFDFFVMLVVIYFLYIEGPGLFTLFLQLSPLRDTHELELLEQFKSAIRATVFGTVVTALLQAVLAAVGFVICGITAWVTLGVVCFFTAMIPFVGATAIWLPASLWLFVQGEMGYGLFLLLWGLLVVSSIDNFVKPLLIQGKTKNHPLLIFFSLIGGIALMGPAGIFYGPVILASLVATITIYRQELARS